MPNSAGWMQGVILLNYHIHLYFAEHTGVSTQLSAIRNATGTKKCLKSIPEPQKYLYSSGVVVVLNPFVNIEPLLV